MLTGNKIIAGNVPTFHVSDGKPVNQSPPAKKPAHDPPPPPPPNPKGDLLTFTIQNIHCYSPIQKLLYLGIDINFSNDVMS